MRLILSISRAACSTKCLDNCSAMDNAVNPRETKSNPSRIRRVKLWTPGFEDLRVD